VGRQRSRPSTTAAIVLLHTTPLSLYFSHSFHSFHSFHFLQLRLGDGQLVLFHSARALCVVVLRADRVVDALVHIQLPTQFFLPPLSAPPSSPSPAPSFGPPPTAEQFAAYRARAERREMVAVVGALVFAAAVLNYVARIHHRLRSLERLYQISKECY